MMDTFQSRYLSDMRMWHLFDPGEVKDYEILVRGDANAPASEALALLERLLPKLADLVKQAEQFLDMFVDRCKFADGNDWFFTGIKIGRRNNEPVSQFCLTFGVDGDTYGEWSVAMREFEGRYYPEVLSRRTF